MRLLKLIIWLAILTVIIGFVYGMVSAETPTQLVQPALPVSASQPADGSLQDSVNVIQVPDVCLQECL